MRLLIYVSDKTYSSGDDSKTASEDFRTSLERKYNTKFVYDDIGAGASWPVFATEITAAGALFVALEIFLRGAEVAEAWKTWKEIFQKIDSFISNIVVLNKEAAAVLAIGKLVEELGKVPKKMELIGYCHTNARTDGIVDRISIENNDKILEGPVGNDLDGAVHWFDISADGKRYQVSIAYSKVTIKLLRKKGKGN
jgi:hypothetical protein